MCVIRRHHLRRDVSLVEINVRPLSALGLMTGHGVGILHLNSVEKVVLSQLFQSLLLGRYIVVIGHYLVEQAFGLLSCQCRGLGSERVQEHRCLHFVTVVIGKLQQHVGKSESVCIPNVAYALHDGPVAIGDKGDGRFLFLRPVIVVLYHHQYISRGDFFFATQHSIANAEVINICPFVASRYNDSLVDAYLCITRMKLFDEFVAGDDGNITEQFPVESYLHFE